jgi:hypothetical protein
MSRFADFFKETHTALGIFYPLHCLVAVFQDSNAAQDAQRKLRYTGVAEDKLIVVGAEEFIEFEKEDTSLGGVLMQTVSRFLSTEQISTDHNIEFARRGAAFVVVYCPSDETKREAWNVMIPLKPLAAHYYGRDGVDHLAGGFSTN